MQTDSIPHLLGAAYSTYLFQRLLRFHSRATGMDVPFGQFLLFLLGCIRCALTYRGLTAALGGGDAVIQENLLDAVLVSECFAYWMHGNARKHRVEQAPGARFPLLGAAMPGLLIACGVGAAVTGGFSRHLALVVCGVAAAIAAAGAWAVFAASRKEKREREENEAARERRMREVAAAPADVAALVAFLGQEENYGVRREAAHRIVAMENGVKRALEVAVGLDAGMVDYMKREAEREGWERAIRELPEDGPMESVLALYRDAKLQYFQQKILARALVKPNGAEQLRQALRGEFAFEAVVLLGEFPEPGVGKQVWSEALSLGEQMEQELRLRKRAEEEFDRSRLSALERAVALLGEKAGGGEKS